jgi:hypothetical protein
MKTYLTIILILLTNQLIQSQNQDFTNYLQYTTSVDSLIKQNKLSYLKVDNLIYNSKGKKIGYNTCHYYWDNNLISKIIIEEHIGFKNSTLNILFKNNKGIYYSENRKGLLNRPKKINLIDNNDKLIYQVSRRKTRLIKNKHIIEFIDKEYIYWRDNLKDFKFNKNST